MIINHSFIKRWFDIQYPNIIVCGSCNYITDYLQLDSYNSIDNYKRFESTYVFDVSKYKTKKSIIDDIQSIINSIDHFGVKQKKNIIILNIDLLHRIYHGSLKTFLHKNHMTSIFMLHSTNINSIDKNIRDMFITMSIPCDKLYDNIVTDTTISITYQKIVKIIKKPLTKTSIDKMKDIVYHYYMNHKTSIDLQRYIITNITSNLYLPNKIKIDIVRDLCELNTYYQHSYRKPIFLEAIIVCLCKHLENYTYHL